MKTVLWLCLLLPPLAVVLWRIGPVLVARYNSAALRVHLPAGASGATAAVSAEAEQALQAWCFAGAGDGLSPFWQPWALPRVDQRFTVARLTQGTGGCAQALAEAFSRHIDGSVQLDALHGRTARIGLRLRVKLRDAMWWRERQPADPWDSGYLVDESAALQALQSFVPRRATLLVAVNLPVAALQQRIALLTVRGAAFAHPVRLLVIGAEVPPTRGAVTEIVAC